MALPSSADDAERELWWAAALHQPGDLVPVDVVGDSLSQQPRDPQPSELRHPPLMYQRGVMVDDLVVDDLVAHSWRRSFHRRLLTGEAATSSIAAAVMASS